MRRIVRLILAICICAVFFGGCSSKKDVIGKWYNYRGKCLDVRSDGSWKLEDSYGTGTWKLLDDGIFEFTDFYGDTQESAINKDDLGEFIDFGWYGNFYRDGYPEKEETKKTEPKEPAVTEAPETRPTTEPTTVPTEPPAVEIDPFDGIKFELTGVSPFCEVLINTSLCVEEAQEYVKYTTDQEYYQNGDTAVVTAELVSRKAMEEYVLKSTEMTVAVKDMPEYITSVEGVDLSPIEKELSDWLDAKTAKTLDTPYIFDTDHGVGTHKAIEAVTENAVYLSSRKIQKHEPNTKIHNYLGYVYSITTRTSNDTSFTLNVVIYACNIIRYPDGTITWGDAGSWDFEFSQSTAGVEVIIANNITAYSDDYNISKIR